MFRKKYTVQKEIYNLPFLNKECYKYMEKTEHTFGDQKPFQV